MGYRGGNNKTHKIRNILLFTDPQEKGSINKGNLTNQLKEWQRKIHL
jgi:hypothetical protein